MLIIRHLSHKMNDTGDLQNATIVNFQKKTQKGYIKLSPLRPINILKCLMVLCEEAQEMSFSNSSDENRMKTDFFCCYHVGK